MNHHKSLSEDILYRDRQQNRNMFFDFDNTVFNQALIFIEIAVISLGGKTLDEYGLPKPDRRQATTPFEILREKPTTTSENLLNSSLRMSPSWWMTRNSIISVEKNVGSLLPRRSRRNKKTFVINLLLAAVRQKKRIALAVASSGISATLLWCKDCTVSLQTISQSVPC